MGEAGIRFVFCGGYLYVPDTGRISPEPEAEHKPLGSGKDLPVPG
jgi:hypothetical protein